MSAERFELAFGEHHIAPSTPAQRAHALKLIKRAELPDDYITLQHRRLLTAMGWTTVQFGNRLGRCIDDVLLQLDKDQCSRLIRELEKEVNS